MQLRPGVCLVSGTLPERPSSWSIPTIDSMINGISDSLMNAGVASFPPVRFLKHRRPGWTPEVSAAHKRSKAAFRNWCISGKDANSLDPLKMVYKNAKRLFRREFRKFLRNECYRFFDSVDFNDRDLFHRLRLERGASTISTSSLSHVL